MTRPVLSEEHIDSLKNVLDGDIKFHNGLSSPLIGYVWRTNDAPMPQSRHDALEDLWRHDLIDIETTHGPGALFGHRVNLTEEGLRTYTEVRGLAVRP